MRQVANMRARVEAARASAMDTSWPCWDHEAQRTLCESAAGREEFPMAMDGRVGVDSAQDTALRLSYRV